LDLLQQAHRTRGVAIYTHAEILLEETEWSEARQVIVLFPAHVDRFVFHVARPEALAYNPSYAQQLATQLGNQQPVYC